METKVYRHYLVSRILLRDKFDQHDKAYTAFLTIYFYDPDSREIYYDLGDPVDYVRVGDGYLFAEFRYERLDLHERFEQDFTESRPYKLPAGKEYDPPRGLRLCAEYNAEEYHNAYARWTHLREQAKNLPIGDRLSDLQSFYERITYDTKRWFGINCKDYLDLLEPREITEQTSSKVFDVNTDLVSSHPDKTKRKVRVVKQFPIKPGTTWHDVELTITQWDKLKISAKGSSKTYHFSKIGFAGRDPELPGALWLLLAFIAEHNGSFNRRTKSNLPAKTELKSQVKNLRKKLKAIIPIDGDPIPFHPSRSDGGTYRVELKKISHEIPYRADDHYRHLDDE